MSNNRNLSCIKCNYLHLGELNSVHLGFFSGFSVVTAVCMTALRLFYFILFIIFFCSLSLLFPVGLNPQVHICTDLMLHSFDSLYFQMLCRVDYSMDC